MCFSGDLADTTLDDLKRDWPLFEQVTGIGAVGTHKSLIRDEKIPSMTVFVDKSSGAIRWNDKGGGPGASGTIVDAYMRLKSVGEKDAIAALRELYGAKPAAKRRPPAPPKPKAHFPTLDALIKSACKDGERVATQHKYFHPGGGYAFTQLRIEGDDGRKRFIAASQDEQGWVMALPAGKRPLYRCDLLAAPDKGKVLLVEGEKCADAAHKYGIPAVTSCGGANAARSSDWSTLQGWDLIASPDNDEQGKAYVEVAQELAVASGARSFRVANLPVGPKEDIADYIEALEKDGKTPDEIAASVKAALEWDRPAQDRKRYSIKGLLAFKPKADPNCLLGDRWLCRGGSCLWIGQTGVGKSSSELQAALMWALGRDFFGIKPTRRLKSVIVQAENDEGDLAEQVQGVIEGNGLTEQADDLENMVVPIEECARTGMEFVKLVEQVVLDEKPDLIWIDPLFAFIGGNANDQALVSGFLRNGLNPILKTHGCAAMVVHHTAKPPRDPNTRNSYTGGDLAYLGHGSAELANWARAVITIRESGEVYELRASKRGMRAGLTTSDLPTAEKTTTTFIKHGIGKICWERAENVQAIREKEQVEACVDACMRKMVPGEFYKIGQVRHMVAEHFGFKRDKRTYEDPTAIKAAEALINRTKTTSAPGFCQIQKREAA